MITEWNGYRVSSCGSIYRKKNPLRTLTPHKSHRGYLMVGVMLGGMLCKKAVHRIVAEAFLGPCPSGMQVDHIDNNRLNNSLANLQYVTAAENVLKSYREGVKDHSGFKASSSKYSADVLTRTLALIASGRTASEVEKATGVKRGTYKNLKNGTHFFCRMLPMTYLKEKYDY